MEGGGEGAPRQWVENWELQWIIIMPFRDGRTENVGTFVFDHPTCVEKVGDYT